MNKILDYQLSKNLIREITIISTPGVKRYTLGEKYNGEVIFSIKLFALHITGDPVEHYCGFNAEGQILFSINPCCPCTIDYEI